MRYATFNSTRCSMTRYRVRGFSRRCSEPGPSAFDPSFAGQVKSVRFISAISKSKTGLACLLLCLPALMLGFAVSAPAQVSDVEEVHIAPHVKPPETTRSEIVDAALQTHTKPMKVDVDLVLVPVTITDPLNRLVTGLDRD